MSLPSNPVGFIRSTIISTANETASLYKEPPKALTIVSVIPKNNHPNAAPGIIPIPPITAATKTIILNGRTQDPTQLVVTDNTFTIYANNSYLLNGKNSLILQVEYNGIISTQEIIFTLLNEEA